MVTLTDPPARTANDQGLIQVCDSYAIGLHIVKKNTKIWWTINIHEEPATVTSNTLWGIQIQHTWTERAHGSVMFQARTLISHGIRQTWSRHWPLKHAHYIINQGIWEAKIPTCAKPWEFFSTTRQAKEYSGRSLTAPNFLTCDSLTIIHWFKPAELHLAIHIRQNLNRFRYIRQQVLIHNQTRRQRRCW